jgi:hypothetical protein
VELYEQIRREYEFGSSDDLWNLLARFLKYCNVTEPPVFDRELFQ